MARTLGRGAVIRCIQRTEILSCGVSERASSYTAQRNLLRYPNVQVIEGDGTSIDIGPRDAILINAGVTIQQSTGRKA